MPQYLIAIQHPVNYDPSFEGEANIRDISAINQQMDEAGARFFAGGLESQALAKSLREQPNGNVSTTDGPYLEAKEYIGCFWILECAHRRSPRLGSQSRPRLPRSCRGPGFPQNPPQS